MIKKKSVSPFTLFREWLLNPIPNIKLKPEIIAALNPRSVLSMFGKTGGITIYLNRYFNNFGTMK